MICKSGVLSRSGQAWPGPQHSDPPHDMVSVALMRVQICALGGRFGPNAERPYLRTSSACDRSPWSSLDRTPPELSLSLSLSRGPPDIPNTREPLGPMLLLARCCLRCLALQTRMLEHASQGSPRLMDPGLVRGRRSSVDQPGSDRHGGPVCFWHVAAKPVRRGA